MSAYPILLKIIELLLAGFAAWTLAYHLVFFARLPSVLTVVPFAVFFAAAARCLRRRRSSGGEEERQPAGGWFAAGVGGLCLITGLAGVTLSRPDPDDLDFFHRALVQAENPWQPYAIHDTIHDLPDLPPISLGHYLTSYEPLAALAGRAAGIGALHCYHNVSAFIVGALLPIIYLLLYRELGTGKRRALLAAAGALAFLVLDGNLHRSFGNFGLVRCWQGKVILVAFLLPLTLLESYRYLRSGSGKDFLAVALCGVSAVGLSGSGIFLLPLFLLAVSLAGLAGGGFSRGSLARAAKLNLAGIYPLAGAALFALRLAPLPADTLIWRDPALWPLTWWGNLQLVLGDLPSIVRNLVILLAIPAVTLRRYPALFLVSLSLVIIILFANPLAGPIWIEILRPGGYWRLAFLFPLPLCAGLFFECFRRQGRSRSAVILQSGTAGAVILLVLFAYRSSVISGRTGLKAPLALRFSPSQLELIRETEGRLSGRRLLAPPAAAAAAALADPSIRLVISRPFITGHIFRNAGRPGEGTRRAAAQKLVWKGERTPETEEAFRESVARGVDALIVVREHLPAVRDLLAEGDGSWVPGGGSDLYALFLKQRAPPDGTDR